jgi:hypothetical protein
MGFQEILKAYDDQLQTDIDGVINDYLLENRVVPPLKKGDVIRVSGLSKMCPREEAICAKDNLTRRDQINPQLSLIFRMGHAFEVAFRDQVLGDTGIVIGKWKCLGCGHSDDMVDGVPRYKKPKSCRKCKSTEFKYMEEFALDKSTMIGGSTDGFLYWNMDYAMLELKTVNTKRFAMVKKAGPFAEHVDQIQAYMKLHGYKKGLIIYGHKDTGADLKFWLDYDPITAGYLFNKGKQVQEFLNEGTMPIRTCINIECPRAEGCAVKDLCFGKYGQQ